MQTDRQKFTLKTWNKQMRATLANRQFVWAQGGIYLIDISIIRLLFDMLCINSLIIIILNYSWIVSIACSYYSYCREFWWNWTWQGLYGNKSFDRSRQANSQAAKEDFNWLVKIFSRWFDWLFLKIRIQLGKKFDLQ